MNRHIATGIAVLAILTAPATMEASSSQRTINQHYKHQTSPGPVDSTYNEAANLPPVISEITIPDHDAGKRHRQQKLSMSAYVYCTVHIEPTKIFSDDYRISISFTDQWYDNYFPATTSSGNVIICNGPIHALNIMSQLGWELVDYFDKTESTPTVPTEFFMRKRVEDLYPTERWQYEKSMESFKRQLE